MSTAYRTILTGSLPIVSMKTFLNTATPGYPVGVWNVSGNYINTATTQIDVVTVWNSDPANQAVGQIIAGPTSTSFYFSGATSLSKIRALRYYMYKAPSNVQLFVGQNDIIKYGSTTKTGASDATIISSDTRREWNRYLFANNGANKTKIPNTNIRLLACTGYSNNSNLYVFHNEDTEYWGVSFSFGFYYIEGAVPKNTKAVGSMAGQFTTNYNLVNNWQELTSMWSFQLLHSGGGPWRWDDPAYFPNLYTPSITQISFGEMVSNFLNTAASFINQTNYPNVTEIFFGANSSAWFLTGQESWFLNMPKVTRYLSSLGGGQNPTATADLVWNNIATNLTGITPVIGSQAELAIRRTLNVSSNSLVSRTYLAAQGWTIVVN